MPRTARLDLPDLLQHVIVRGVDRCDIFRDDADRTRFLQSLSKLLLQTGTECLAWSLMTNHLHLLLRPRRSRLAPFMRRLLTGYAIYFNRRHKRSGHLFQNRYKSLVCDEDAYLIELVRYIHLNPLPAGLVDDLAALDRYSWSGHAVLMGNRALEGQAVEEVLALFSGANREARRRYRVFIADGIPLGRREDLTSGGKRKPDAAAEEGAEVPCDASVLGGGEYVEQLRMRQELRPRIPRNFDLRELIEGVCGRFEIDPGQLRHWTRRARIAAARSVVCYLAVRHMGHSGVEVGRALGLGRAGVSVAAARGEEIVKNDPALMKLIDK